MNVVHLIGRVGRQPEIKHTQSGMAVCNLSLATSKKTKGEEKTAWHRCVAFDKTADLIGKYIAKGDQLGVEGEISYGSYDKDGVTVYTTTIVVNRIHFIGSKKTGQQQGQNQNHQQGQQNNYQGGQQDNQQNHQQNEDIPF